MLSAWDADCQLWTEGSEFWGAWGPFMFANRMVLLELKGWGGGCVGMVIGVFRSYHREPLPQPRTPPQAQVRGFGGSLDRIPL